MRLIDADSYCENICRCNKERCDKGKCPVHNAPTIEAASEMNWEWNGFNDFIRAMKEAYPTSKSGYTEFDVYFRDVMSRFTAEEREAYGCDVMLDCKLPEEDEEILVTYINGYVDTDVFLRDGYECYLDSGADFVTGAIAWMPKPKGYQPKEEKT